MRDVEHFAIVNELLLHDLRGVRERRVGKGRRRHEVDQEEELGQAFDPCLQLSPEFRLEVSVSNPFNERIGVIARA